MEDMNPKETALGTDLANNIYKLISDFNTAHEISINIAMGALLNVAFIGMSRGVPSFSDDKAREYLLEMIEHIYRGRRAISEIKEGNCN